MGIEMCCGVLYILALVLIWPITQHMLSGAQFTLPAAVIYPCSGESAWLTNDASVHFPALVRTEFDAYNTTLSTDAFDEAGRPMKTVIGHSTFPKMSWKRGDNMVDFTTAVTLAHTDSLQTDFIVPMTQGKTVKLYIDADVMTGRLLGVLPVPFLHMHKVLRCHATKMTVTHKNPCYRGPLAKTTDSTSPETDDLFQQLLGRRLQTTVGDQQQGYQMQCVVDNDDPSVVV